MRDETPSTFAFSLSDVRDGVVFRGLICVVALGIAKVDEKRETSPAARGLLRHRVSEDSCAARGEMGEAYDAHADNGASRRSQAR